MHVQRKSLSDRQNGFPSNIHPLSVIIQWRQLEEMWPRMCAYCNGQFHQGWEIRARNVLVQILYDKVHWKPNTVCMNTLHMYIHKIHIHLHELFSSSHILLSGFLARWQHVSRVVWGEVVGVALVASQPAHTTQHRQGGHRRRATNQDSCKPRVLLVQHTNAARWWLHYYTGKVLHTVHTLLYE